MPTYSPTLIDEPRPVATLQRRRWRTTVAAVTFAVVLATGAVAWSAQSTDGAPGVSPDHQGTPSMLESPAEFDRAIANAVRNSEDDSIMHDGDAFDRAVEAEAAN